MFVVIPYALVMVFTTDTGRKLLGFISYSFRSPEHIQTKLKSLNNLINLVSITAKHVKLYAT